ncbi:MAG TPA: Hsp20/alpha crystallin family protein [Candidatus Kapabacteria bacterium]|nr:Hsp20/alpha crystallin family protein [Candidatus Kapabacteria bacterium]
MALVRWQPFRELERVSNWIDNYMNDGFHSLGVGNFVPSVDISEDEKNVYVHVELPGLTKDDVKVLVNDDNILTIRGEKKHEEKQENKNYYRMERCYGAFVRSLPLPAPVKADAIDAKFKDGILNITLPKVEPSKPKEREIQIS